jgi:hypothetical protein
MELVNFMSKWELKGSNIIKSSPWLSEGIFPHACAIVDAIIQFGT